MHPQLLHNGKNVGLRHLPVAADLHHPNLLGQDLQQHHISGQPCHQAGAGPVAVQEKGDAVASDHMQAHPRLPGDGAQLFVFAGKTAGRQHDAPPPGIP